MTAICCLLAAVALDGVTGSEIEVRAGVDSNNVRAGDLVSFTLDFYGLDDCDALQPPRLAGEFDPKVWKIADATAKAETSYAERQVFLGVQRIPMARRLTYGLRPLVPGVHTIPSLEFQAGGVQDGVLVRTAPIPLRVAPAPAVVSEGSDQAFGMARPDGLVVDLVSSPWGSAVDISDDTLFAWRKACADPNPEAFASFDFPEARLNEAACELMTNNWSRALAIYSKLEWRIGQTPEIERGIRTALAQKSAAPSAELPLWRRALRPFLKFALAGRIACISVFAALVALAVWFARRRVRALACAVIAMAAASAVHAQGRTAHDPFAEIERIRKQMDDEMNAMFGGGFGGGMSMNFGSMTGGMQMMVNGQPVPSVEIKATMDPDHADITVGEPFNMILSVETPRGCTIEPSAFKPSRSAGFVIAGRPSRLADGQSSDTNNVISRISIPVRYDAPFEGSVTCSIGGMLTRRVTSNAAGRSFSSTFSTDFRVETAPVWMKVSPLPGVNRPDDYTGVVGSGVELVQKAVNPSVATNDVVAIECKLSVDGYIPPGAVCGGVRTGDGVVSFRRYFIADGSPVTDGFTFSWYDPSKKDFQTRTWPGVALTYFAESPARIAPEGSGEDAPVSEKPAVLSLRFAPREESPEVARIAADSTRISITEKYGDWCRVDDGERAGWVKKEDLP
ncbi:MAG: hypothetical protein K6F50_01340 [Kiritimatiellae bacterium]|nr:hypothetical protein [Kiritimatiellia bacterium]